MCRKHWAMVPRPAQSQVWATYRPGQEVDKRPSGEYLVAHRLAVLHVAIKEKRLTGDAVTRYCQQYSLQDPRPPAEAQPSQGSLPGF